VKPVTSTTLPDTDLHAVVKLIDDARHDEPGEVVPWAVLENLDQLIGAVSVQLTELDWVDRSLVAQQYVAAGEKGVVVPLEGAEFPEAEEYFRHVADTGFLPCTHAQQSGDLVSVLRWSDFYTGTELRNHEAVRAYFEPIRHGVAVCLPAPPGRMRRVIFFRESGGDFTDRDVALLSLLRPHLHEILVDAEGRRGGVPKLTPREWEVLAMAGEGLNNAAIARRLYVSPATVRKHMEHVFDHLGVRNRYEAAAVALPHRPHHMTLGASARWSPQALRRLPLNGRDTPPGSRLNQPT
jgi:DNA-binding CsgD family transcriptional regulator